MKDIRVFVAHTKDESDDQVQTFVDMFQLLYPDRILTFTTGKQDWDRNFKKCGGWNQWTKNVVHGTIYGSTEKTYNVILVTRDVVGKATRDIVEHAIKANTTVAIFSNDGTNPPKLKRVRGIEVVDSQDYKAGWKMIY